MTTEGTRATHKLGALNAAIQETRLLRVKVTQARKGVPSLVPAAMGPQL